MKADIEKSEITFRHRATGTPPSGRLCHILIDGLEWAIATGTPEGRHGFRFHFTDAGGNTVMHDPEPGRRGGRVSYHASAARRADIDAVLRECVIRMVKDEELHHPAISKETAAAARSRRDQMAAQQTAEKRQLWEGKADEAIRQIFFGKFLSEQRRQIAITAIIAAMEWAQSQ